MRTKQCHECHQSFRRDELIDYASPGSKTLNSYCPKCLEQKQLREQFSNKVCMIFGLKAPGPRIWTERKRIQDTYGYTDDVIINCLDYIYNVQKKKKLAESLCLVTPKTINEMNIWRQSESAKLNSIVAAYKTEVKTRIASVRENTTSNKKNWNPDDWLDD